MNQTFEISDDTLSTLHLLSMDNEYLQMLYFFYEKQNEYPIKQRAVMKKFDYKTSTLTTYHLRKILNLQLIKKEKSAIIDMDLGYSITLKGIKFIKLFKQLQIQLKYDLKEKKNV